MTRKKHKIDIQLRASTEGKDKEHPLRTAAAWAALIALIALAVFLPALIAGADCAPLLGKAAFGSFFIALILFFADIIRDPGHSSQDNVTCSVS